MNTELVQLSGQKAFTTSLIIAEQCDNKSHESVIKLLRKYKSDFEEFDKLRFEIQKVDFKGENQGRPVEYCHLTEDQATYLITLFRNTPTVRKFKVALVKAFRAALNEINRLYANPPRTEILTGKRKAHHPMMDSLIEFRADLGKQTATVHFMCENKLCNGIVTGEYKAIDESTLSNADAELLMLVRKKNDAFLQAGLEYKDRQSRLIAFATRHRTKLISKE